MASAKRVRFFQGLARLRRYRCLRNLPPPRQGSALTSPASCPTIPDRAFPNRPAHHIDTVAIIPSRARMMGERHAGEFVDPLGQGLSPIVNAGINVPLSKQCSFVSQAIGWRVPQSTMLTVSRSDRQQRQLGSISVV
jgi:hypothetical protein